MSAPSSPAASFLTAMSLAMETSPVHDWHGAITATRRDVIPTFAVPTALLTWAYILLMFWPSPYRMAMLAAASRATSSEYSTSEAPSSPLANFLTAATYLGHGVFSCS